MLAGFVVCLRGRHSAREADRSVSVAMDVPIRRFPANEDANGKWRVRFSGLPHLTEGEEA